MSGTISIDVIVDVVCPWCFVGKRELDLALNTLGREKFSVMYRPYQLSPETPKQGVDRKVYYEKKFGNSPELEKMRGYLTTRGRDLGIKFDFESPCLIANTLDVHRLIRWAHGAGCEEFVIERLMQDYFEHSQFIGDHEYLMNVAAQAGMDRAIVEKLLSSGADADKVTSEINQARSLGVTGVPFYIIDQKSAIVGAEPANQLIEKIIPFL